MALPKTPITVQVSPSTYMLMMKLTELGVEYIPGTDDLRFKTGVQAALDNLYNALLALAPAPKPSLADLQKLQQDGLEEASEINKKAGSEVTMTC